MYGPSPAGPTFAGLLGLMMIIAGIAAGMVMVEQYGWIAAPAAIVATGLCAAIAYVAYRGYEKSGGWDFPADLLSTVTLLGSAGALLFVVATVASVYLLLT